MARKKSSATKSPEAKPPTFTNKRRGIEILTELLKQVPELRTLDKDSQEFQEWLTTVLQIFIRLFGENTEMHKSINRVDFGPANFFNPTSEEFKKGFQGGLDSAEAIIKSAVRTLSYDLEGDQLESSSSSEQLPTTQSGFDPHSKTVFVVHGHDDGARETVARFIESGGLNAVILHEKPNSGKTLIEKFESNALTASFAVILLSADDLGSSKKDYETDGVKALVSRARQNVVFEYGYFVGKLGRDRVCPLLFPDVEKPSDIDGIAYVSYESHWKNELARELSAAGIEFDFGKAFGLTS